LTNTSFIGGPKVKRFESAFASFVGVDYCVSCANGTDALEIALQALGIGKGDEVIVPAMSWIATSEAVKTAGATVVFADVLPDKHTIDPVDIARKITDNTAAIIPVHLYGCSAEMDQIMVLAKKHNLKVIEDSAQAHGAKFNGQSIGTFGDIATFSFYPGKNLGAYGDAGGMVTNDLELANTCRVISNHGQVTKHNHQIEGRNSRMDTLQAAVLEVKLKHLEAWTSARLEKAKKYNELLQGLPVKLPVIEDQHRHVFHVYAVRIANRDLIKAKLEERGIATQIHYPQSLPELTPYIDRFDAENYPHAKALGADELSLPIYPELKNEQMEYIAGVLRDVL
jgi:dTDP-4-amino-4,6-dideoxygalactose transaminase